jgi:hypothetical protein
MTTMMVSSQSLCPLQIDYDLCTHFHGLQTATHLTVNLLLPHLTTTALDRPLGLDLPVHGGFNDTGQLFPLLLEIILYQNRS